MLRHTTLSVAAMMLLVAKVKLLK